jgi:multidrug efflux system membrane fusion protein
VLSPKVTLGPSDGKSTVILSGLNIGDSVVTEGTDRLSDGARITVAATPAPQKSQALEAPSPVKKTDVGDASPSAPTPQSR